MQKLESRVLQIKDALFFVFGGMSHPGELQLFVQEGDSIPLPFFLFPPSLHPQGMKEMNSALTFHSFDSSGRDVLPDLMPLLCFPLSCKCAAKEQTETARNEGQIPCRHWQ